MREESLKSSLLSHIMLFIVLSMLFIPHVSADEILYFNEGEQTVLFEFTETVTEGSFYIDLPKNHDVVSASMTLTGESSETTIKLPADVVVVTDLSGSMKKDINSWSMGNTVPPANCHKAYTDQDVRKTDLARCLLMDVFIESVMENPNNRIWPIYFHSDVVHTYADDPSNKEVLKNYVGSSSTFPTNGADKTCLACAINEANNILRNNYDPAREKFIFLMTDGAPTHCAEGSCSSDSIIYGNKICEGYCDTNGNSGCTEEIGCELTDSRCEPAESNTKVSAQSSIDDGVTFFTLAFGLVEACDRANNLLIGIAEDSGGFHSKSSNPVELKQIYQDIADSILTESVTTYPSPAVAGNAWVKSSFGEEATWLNNECGTEGASCNDLANILQYYIDNCDEVRPGYCRADFTINSDTLGILTLSGLSIVTQPKGEIACISPDDPPLYSLEAGPFAFPIADVFSFSGEIGDYDYLTSSDPIITAELVDPDMIKASENDLIDSITVDLELKGQYTDPASCPVTFSVNPDDFGKIICNQPGMPRKLMSEAEPTETISLEEIYDFVGPEDYGTPRDIFDTELYGVSVSSGLPQDIIFERTDLLGTKISEVSIRTTNGVVSKLCPVELSFMPEDMIPDCDSDPCYSELRDQDLSDLKSLGCLEPTDIEVYNPYYPLRLYNIYPDLGIFDFFQAETNMQIQPSSGDFDVDPIISQKYDLIRIDGTSVAHDDEGVYVSDVYIGDDVITYCALLTRKNFVYDEQVSVIESELLVTSSMALAGYFDDRGAYAPKGPFIFTAKVWLRKP